MPNETHVALVGDTFESLSTRYFGEPSKAGRIRQANPGAGEVFVPGSLIIIPADATEGGLGTEADGLVMRIAGVAFTHITQIALTRRVDAVDTVEITAPQAETEAFADLMTPLSFQDLEVADRGKLLLRGTLVSVAPSLTADGSFVKLGGYSLPGVLMDCNMPASSYPIQYRNLNLQDIASKVSEPFSLAVVSEGDVGGPFPRVKLKRTQKVLPFLAGLAKQRQVLVRSNPDGELVLAAPPELVEPVARLKEGEPPILSITAEFAPQTAGFSHLTGVRSTRRRRKGSVYTAVNPLIQSLGVVRPLTISMRDTAKGEMPKATTAAMGRMLAGAVTYTVKVATWQDPNGAEWAPGTTVELEAPTVFVRSPYQFQIRSVKFERSADGDTATLLLMLPGAFGGEPPTVLPWS